MNHAAISTYPADHDLRCLKHCLIVMTVDAIPAKDRNVPRIDHPFRRQKLAT